MRLGHHVGTIEIHWLVYSSHCEQPESTRGCIPLIWCIAFCSVVWQHYHYIRKVTPCKYGLRMLAQQ